MCPQEFLINARFKIKSCEIGRSNELDEIAVSFHIASKQHELARRIILVSVGSSFGRESELYPDNRFETRFFRVFIELKSPIEITGVRERNRTHPELFGASYKFFGSTKSLQKRIVCMGMKVDERHYN
jgi:hypothetical protein